MKLQDVSLNFMRSLEMESHEELLNRYRTEFEEENARLEPQEPQDFDGTDGWAKQLEDAGSWKLFLQGKEKLDKQLEDAKDNRAIFSTPAASWGPVKF